MIPVLGIIIVSSFGLYQYSGADPTSSLLVIRGIVDSDQSRNNYEQEYKNTATELGRDIPRFYFSVIPSYYPDTLYKILLPNKRDFSLKLLNQYRDWSTITTYLDLLEKANKISRDYVLSQNIEQALFQFNRTVDPEHLQRINSSISNELNESPDIINNTILALKEHQELLQNSERTFFYPKLLYHGNSNQFHNWFKNICTGNFGASLVDGRSVKSKIVKSLKWTISLSLLSIVFASFLSIIIGFITAYKRNKILDKLIYIILFILFSIPLFWLATLMVVFFTSDDFGTWTNIFHPVGVFYPGQQGVLKEFINNSTLLILPIFCMVLSSTAYLSRQVRSSILIQEKEAYFLSALSKGMSRVTALRTHVLPNALLPFITIISAAIPSSLAGALVIEVIFNIPGTGRLMFQSILNDDWNSISAILIVISIATMIFFLIGDILYAYVNPRIKLES